MAVNSNLRLLSDYIVKNIPNEIDRKTLSKGMSLSLRQEIKLGEYHRNRQPMHAGGRLYNSARVRFNNRKTISNNLLFDVIMLRYGFYQSDGYEFRLDWQNMRHASIIARWMASKGMIDSDRRSPETQAKQFIYFKHRYGNDISATNWIEKSMQRGIENNFNINISDKFRQEFSDRLIKAILDGKQ